MQLFCDDFFDIPKDKFIFLNLNELYLKNKLRVRDSKDPRYLDNLITIERLKDFPDSIYTYGGWGEDRKDVWKGTYLDETGEYIHLGIDINVRKFTKVTAPFDGEIIDVFTDIDTKIGWGGRLILKSNTPNTPYLVLAHLDPTSLTNRTQIKKGEILGEVGTWPTNGNTFCHLHVQCINYEPNSTFDGYGTYDDLINNPNPFNTNY